jgi:hypothetical protein
MKKEFKLEVGIVVIPDGSPIENILASIASYIIEADC